MARSAYPDNTSTVGATTSSSANRSDVYGNQEHGGPRRENDSSSWRWFVVATSRTAAVSVEGDSVGVARRVDDTVPTCSVRVCAVVTRNNSPSMRSVFSPGASRTGGFLVRGGRANRQRWLGAVLGRLHGDLMSVTRHCGIVGRGAGAQLAIDRDHAAPVADPDRHAVPPR